MTVLVLSQSCHILCINVLLLMLIPVTPERAKLRLLLARLRTTNTNTNTHLTPGLLLYNWCYLHPPPDHQTAANTKQYWETISIILHSTAPLRPGNSKYIYLYLIVISWFLISRYFCSVSFADCPISRDKLMDVINIFIICCHVLMSLPGTWVRLSQRISNVGSSLLPPPSSLLHI